jgi:S-methylmethionine-dependent homocysteine/selenocysteine methylase
MTFEQTLASRPLLLMEGAVIERLRRARPDLLHPRLVIAPLVQTAEGRAALSRLYREYIAIAKHTGLPMVLSTPTWRASKDRHAEEQQKADLNGDAVTFMHRFKSEYSPLFVAGQMGCRNDCYQPAEALSREAAVDFHRWQVQRLAHADFLYGVTLPAATEALGMAQAMAETDRPYIISFVIGKEGCLLDGTPLERAIEQIDAKTQRPPLGYGANCCYPAFLQAATLSPSSRERMISIQANASSLSHEELDQADELHTDDPADWCDRMLALHRSLGLKILGGCCGTDASYLQTLTQNR